MSSDFVRLLHTFPSYAQQIAHVEPIAPRPPRYAAPAAPLPPALAAALAERGVSQLYAHQAAALDAARSGQHVGVVTATASGKTLCYQLPAIETILQEAGSRALLLFPTKALAHDQLRSLQGLLDALNHDGAQAAAQPSIIAATLDGDTPRQLRDTIRAQGQMILSNPDMLHRAVLPDHRRWSNLLANLRFVVLDEAHTYRGVFGTHVALVLRRLRRLCAHYGSAPQFICCSATSANPEEHLAALVGDAVAVIDQDGAPQGHRSFVFWNPPVIEQRRTNSGQRNGSLARSSDEAGRRRSTNIEVSSLLAHLVRSSVKTLAFTRTRRGAELVLRYTKTTLERDRQMAPIAAYRAGYAPEQRRQLEQSFLSGELTGLVSTNALELGVDIGGVDAVLIGGFPGSVASTWQQAGRAGRSQGHCLAVLVAQDDPLDQFYMRHPEEFFARSHEHARVALDNPFILRDQMRCAGSELPLHEADELWFGPTFTALREWMVRHGELYALDDGTAAADGRPSAEVNIRSADGEPIVLKDAESGRTIEQLPATRAPFEAYPGAIYLNQGDTYVIAELGSRVALARRADVDYYTQPREETEIAVERVREQRELGPSTLHLGVVEVTRRVVGYKRKRHYTEEVLSEHDLALPPQTFRTVAVWWTVPEPICRQVQEVAGDVLDGLHAMEHACIGLLPLFAQCDRADIGGLSTNFHPDTNKATIFVYDGVPGGVGIAQVGYEQAEAWWAQTLALLGECPCLDGCPSCVQSPKCGNGNQHLSKPGAAALAALLLSRPLPKRDVMASLAAPSDGMMSQHVIADLRERLRRVRATPPGPRRAALLVALRYRMTVERANLSDAAATSALAELEQQAAGL